MKFLYLIVGLTFSNIAFGQSKVDLTYFTLGLVDDYSGRTIVKSDKLDLAKIDQFHEFEWDLMDFLDSLINEENKLRDITKTITKKRVRRNEPNCTNCHEFFYYYSKELADEVNKRFKFKFAHSWDEKNRKIYRGDIKSSTLKSESQRLSFLSGAFVRVGSVDNDAFVYNLANSRGHFKSIVKSLKKLNSELVEIKIVEGTPTSQKIYFKPTDQLRLELERYLGLKKKIKERRSGIPDKILIKREENYHTHFIGHTNDGRQFFGYQTFVFPDQITDDWQKERKEYVVLYIFDKKGNYLTTNHWYAGKTSETNDNQTREKLEQMIKELGEVKYTDIKVKPFQTTIDGIIFGLIADEESETVELQPSSTMSFQEPWDGEYYT